MSNTIITEFTVDWDILKAVSLIASRDETRYVLNGVQVEYTPEQALLVVTDGRRLCAVRIPFPEKKKDASCKFIIPLELINAVRVKGVNRNVTIRHNSQSDRIKISHFYLSVSLKAVQGNYPNWRQIVPNKTGIPKSAPSFRPGQLADFHKVTKAMLPNSEPSVRLFQQEELGPFIIENGSKDFFGVIMPIRIPESQKEYTFPTWL